MNGTSTCASPSGASTRANSSTAAGGSCTCSNVPVHTMPLTAPDRTGSRVISATTRVPGYGTASTVITPAPMTRPPAPTSRVGPRSTNASIASVCGSICQVTGGTSRRIPDRPVGQYGTEGTLATRRGRAVHRLRAATVVTVTDVRDEIERGDRFAFGENWTRFLAEVDEARISAA